MKSHVVPAISRGILKPTAARVPHRLQWLVVSCVICGGALLTWIDIRLAAAAAAAAFVVLVAARAAITRPAAVFALVYLIPFALGAHVVYIEHVGAADGITVEVTDLLTLWLIWEYFCARASGTWKPVHALRLFLYPFIAWLLADCLSLLTASDLVIGLYGILSHFKAFVFFLALAAILHQGQPERRAAIRAVVFAVASIGIVCLVECVQGVNYTRTANIVADLEDAAQTFRAAGVNTPTLTASYLASLMPLVVLEAVCARGRLWRLMTVAACGLGLAGMAATLSRAAMIFTAVSLALLLLMLLSRNLVSRRTIIVLAAAAGLLAIIVGPSLTTRAVEEEGSNVVARMGLNITAFNMAAESPVIGLGINNYTLRMWEFAPKRRLHHFEYLVHNKFMLTLAETGVVGLAAFVWLILTAIYGAWRLARTPDPLGPALLCSILVLVCTLNFEPFESDPIIHNAWFLIAMVAACTTLTEQSAQGFARGYGKITAAPVRRPRRFDSGDDSRRGLPGCPV